MVVATKAPAVGGASVECGRQQRGYQVVHSRYIIQNELQCEVEGVVDGGAAGVAQYWWSMHPPHHNVTGCHYELVNRSLICQSQWHSSTGGTIASAPTRWQSMTRASRRLIGQGMAVLRHVGYRVTVVAVSAAGLLSQPLQSPTFTLISEAIELGITYLSKAASGDAIKYLWKVEDAMEGVTCKYTQGLRLVSGFYQLYWLPASLVNSTSLNGTARQQVWEASLQLSLLERGREYSPGLSCEDAAGRKLVEWAPLEVPYPLPPVTCMRQLPDLTLAPSLASWVPWCREDGRAARVVPAGLPKLLVGWENVFTACTAVFGSFEVVLTLQGQQLSLGSCNHPCSALNITPPGFANGDLTHSEGPCTVSAPEVTVKATSNVGVVNRTAIVVFDSNPPFFAPNASERLHFCPRLPSQSSQCQPITDILPTTTTLYAHWPKSMAIDAEGGDVNFHWTLVDVSTGGELFQPEQVWMGRVWRSGLGLTAGLQLRIKLIACDRFQQCSHIVSSAQLQVKPTPDPSLVRAAVFWLVNATVSVSIPPAWARECASLEGQLGTLQDGASLVPRNPIPTGHEWQVPLGSGQVEDLSRQLVFSRVWCEAAGGRWLSQVQKLLVHTGSPTVHISPLPDVAPHYGTSASSFRMRLTATGLLTSLSVAAHLNSSLLGRCNFTWRSDLHPWHPYQQLVDRCCSLRHAPASNQLCLQPQSVGNRLLSLSVVGLALTSGDAVSISATATSISGTQTTTESKALIMLLNPPTVGAPLIPRPFDTVQAPSCGVNTSLLAHGNNTHLSVGWQEMPSQLSGSIVERSLYLISLANSANAEVVAGWTPRDVSKGRGTLSGDAREGRHSVCITLKAQSGLWSQPQCTPFTIMSSKVEFESQPVLKQLSASTFNCKWQLAPYDGPISHIECSIQATHATLASTSICSDEMLSTTPQSELNLTVPAVRLGQINPQSLTCTVRVHTLAGHLSAASSTAVAPDKGVALSQVKRLVVEVLGLDPHQPMPVLRFLNGSSAVRFRWEITCFGAQPCWEGTNLTVSLRHHHHWHHHEEATVAVIDVGTTQFGHSSVVISGPLDHGSQLSLHAVVGPSPVLATARTPAFMLHHQAPTAGSVHLCDPSSIEKNDCWVPVGWSAPDAAPFAQSSHESIVFYVEGFEEFGCVDCLEFLAFVNSSEPNITSGTLTHTQHGLFTLPLVVTGSLSSCSTLSLHVWARSEVTSLESNAVVREVQLLLAPPSVVLAPGHEVDSTGTQAYKLAPTVQDGLVWLDWPMVRGACQQTLRYCLLSELKDPNMVIQHACVDDRTSMSMPFSDFPLTAEGVNISLVIQDRAGQILSMDVESPRGENCNTAT